MRVALSIPDELFEFAEAPGKRLGVGVGFKKDSVANVSQVITVDREPRSV
jgi:hypothetical protein